MLFEPYVRLSSGNLMAAYWEITAHSAYDMFPKYKYLIVIMFYLFPTSVLRVGISF